MLIYVYKQENSNDKPRFKPIRLINTNCIKEINICQGKEVNPCEYEVGGELRQGLLWVRDIEFLIKKELISVDEK